MRYKFMSEHREYSLSKWAVFLKVSLSGYHAWHRRFPSRLEGLSILRERIRAIFTSGRSTYGAERICGILRQEGSKSSYVKVKREMISMGLFSIHTRHRSRSLTDSRKARDERYINYAKDMTIDRPLKLITSDISYIRTREGYLYLCAVRDAFTGLVLSHTTSERMTKELVLSAINAARLPNGTIFHSDRGSQYTANDVQKLLHKKGVVQSFSRVGTPGDNSWGESFFSILKKESVHWRQFKTRDEAKLDLFEYIQAFYNNRRVQKRLGYLTPSQFNKAMCNKQYCEVA